MKRNNFFITKFLAVITSFFAVALFTYAATTISTNVNTGGTLTVSGASTLTGAVSMASTLAVSASTTFNGVEYKWPSADGTNGQMLATNAAGGLSWSTVATSQWTTLSSNIYFNTGKVGIGTTSPYATLSVVGPVVASYFHATSSTATSTFSGAINIATTAANGAGVILKNGSLFLHSFGTNNLFAGASAGNLTLSGADHNVGLGDSALPALTTGDDNVGVGRQSLFSNVTGSRNTAVGHLSLYTTTGSDNVAVGEEANYQNDTGTKNVAIGNLAMYGNQTGSNNVVVGYDSEMNDTNLSNVTLLGANIVGVQSSTTIIGGTGINAVKVGIGTTSPARILSVQGTSYVSGTGFFGGNLIATSSIGVGGTSTPATEIAATAAATTTIYLDSTGTRQGGCIELKGTDGTMYRMYIAPGDVTGFSTSSPNGGHGAFFAVWEAGSCK